MTTLFAYLRLMRPANLLTAVADICLGYAASGLLLKFTGLFNYTPIDFIGFHWLIWATLGLYGGGVVFNDVFDYELDKKERPERSLPSGKASLLGATLLGIFLLIFGVFSASQVSWLSAGIAGLVVVLVLLYDSLAKHHVFFGPLVMGLCRGGNLALGMSIAPESLLTLWFLPLIPIVYIAAITLISRGEVHGGNRPALLLGFGMYVLVFLAIISLGFYPRYHLLFALPFGILFAFLILPPLRKAWIDLQAKNVFKAVKAGVLALIVLDATLSAGFAGWEYGLVVLLLLPISMFLARIFSVT